MARRGSLDSPRASPSANAIGNGVVPLPLKADPLPQQASFEGRDTMNNVQFRVVGTWCLTTHMGVPQEWTAYQIRSNSNSNRDAKPKPSIRWSTLHWSPISNSRTNPLHFYRAGSHTSAVTPHQVSPASPPSTTPNSP